MARGQAQKADSQLNLNNQAADQYGKAGHAELGPLEAGAGELVNSQGYDPQTLSAITNAGMGGVNAAFGDAAGKINRQSAITKNPAGTAANLDTLAMDKGRAGGQEAGDIQMQNANFKASQRAQGLNILQGLYGTNADASTRLMGNAPGILGSRAAGGGWAQGFQSVLSGIGSILPKSSG